ncbi:MAG: MnmC family methyltransferase [Snowella sp.]|nr:MnmC family methyltransferase [Snowella sp.]
MLGQNLTVGDRILSEQTLIPQVTEDGSFTFFSTEFEEKFHSQSGAKEESEGKFVLACQLAQKAAQTDHLFLLDVCYGLGYNTASALERIWSVNPRCKVTLIALELDLNVPRQAIAYHLLDQWADPIPQWLKKLALEGRVENPLLKAELLSGDARLTLQQVQSSGFKADAIFLDPFSPPKCPQLWTVEFLTLLAQSLAIEGRLATYSCAASVRTALSLAGLKFGAGVQVGRRSPGTVANFTGQDLPPISDQEQEHLQTRAAIAYRDPDLQDSAETIVERRKAEQETSDLEPTSHWKKRWLRHSSPINPKY